MHKIVAVQRGSHQELTSFKLDDGTVLNYSQTVEAIQKGLLQGYNVGHDRNGYDSIKSNNDGDPTNNLSELPEF